MALKDCNRRAVITYNRNVSFFVKTKVWEAKKKKRIILHYPWKNEIVNIFRTLLLVTLED